MSLSNKQVIIDGAYKFADFSREYSIEEYASKLLQKYGSIPPIDADRYSNKFKRSIANYLKELNDNLNRSGKAKIGTILPGNRISWSISTDYEKLIWRNRPIILEIIEKLSDDEFESLCCTVISSMGGKAWKTKSKGDGNVDLYGILSTNEQNHVFGKSTKLRIVGQCKNYAHKEVITQYESFYQALSNVRFRAGRVISEIPADFLTSKGPIVGWYVCKDGFQSGIYDDAQQHGIILSDKYDLAEILCGINLEGISSHRLKVKLCLMKLVRKHNE
ncbi:restriction endonuclease [Lewinella sp. IMCC34183]|uniref:restriction endonuclease n=1 Tax=Lewinella sp. IMCC34183 TaxID=2248762 RepID=UPI001E2D6534|nr:restriction endonuclease [Lewinella sp. IMCC34183]